MSLNKVTYTDSVTVIGATNLNAIQDEIIKNANSIASDESGIASLQTQISNEVTGRKTDVQSLQSNIDKNTISITGLKNDVDAEVARATTAENTKQDKLALYSEDESDSEATIEASALGHTSTFTVNGINVQANVEDSRSDVSSGIQIASDCIELNCQNNKIVFSSDGTLSEGGSVNGRFLTENSTTITDLKNDLTLYGMHIDADGHIYINTED